MEVCGSGWDKERIKDNSKMAPEKDRGKSSPKRNEKRGEIKKN